MKNLLLCLALVVAGLLGYLVREGRPPAPPGPAVAGTPNSEDDLAEPSPASVSIKGRSPEPGAEASELELPEPGDSEGSAESTDQLDPSGVLDSQRLEFLLIARDQMIAKAGDQADPLEQVRSEVALIQRCIAAVLHSLGEVEWGTEEVRRRGGFSLRPTQEGEHVFAMDQSCYRFMEGRFIAYDLARERMENLVLHGQARQKPPGYDLHIEAAFEAALNTF